MDEKTRRVFFEIHSGNPREGPGSREATERALASIPSLPDAPRILDVGCGPGAQTRDLADLSGGTVYALDLYPQYLRRLQREARLHHPRNRILPIRGDMSALPFQPNAFDLLWSEGAIYIMGFETGLEAWKPLLKPGGYLAVTDIAWLQDDPPEELRAFFADEVPDMTSIEGTVRIIQRSGYRLIDRFLLPGDAWWNYYAPIEEKLGAMREKYGDDPESIRILAIEETEIAMYRRHAEYYGYVFYIMRGPE